MMPDRFAYASNLERATRYQRWRSPLWPPDDEYRLHCLDLASAVPSLGPDYLAELESLRSLVDAEWQRVKTHGGDGKGPMHHAGPIAERMRRIATYLPSAVDRTALGLRADAVERGYDEEGLSRLAGLDETIAFVAGRISTWYGKQRGGLPTAFGCVRNVDAQAAVAAAVERLDDIAAYLRALHSGLRLGAVPAFSATTLFFMAGGRGCGRGSPTAGARRGGRTGRRRLDHADGYRDREPFGDYVADPLSLYMEKQLPGP
jgi:hypothetical protein